MGSRPYSSSVNSDRAGIPPRNELANNRTLRATGGSDAARGTLCSSPKLTKLLPALDDGVSVRCNPDPHQHGARFQIPSGDIPGIRDPLGRADNACSDMGSAAGPEGWARSTAHLGGFSEEHGILSCQDTAALSRRYLAHRRLRASLFGSGLFADPAWDMMLDLYAQEVSNRRVSVSSICLAAAVPSSTAMGWLNRLEEKGLIYREEDAHDARRTFVRLSAAAFDKVDHWLRVHMSEMRSQNINGISPRNATLA